MSSKDELALRPSLRRCSLAIIILSTSGWWVCTNALAQEVRPAGSQTTALSATWSLEKPVSNDVPHLVIGMLQPGDALSYSSLRLPQGNAATPSPKNSLLAPAANRNEKDSSAPLVLSSLSTPAPEVRNLANLRSQPASAPQAAQRPAGSAGANAYSLLNDRSAYESFLNGQQANYLANQPRLAGNESFTHPAEPGPGPLLQLELGSWNLPVKLSSNAVSR